eukprot:gene52125-13570_t
MAAAAGGAYGEVDAEEALGLRSPSIRLFGSWIWTINVGGTCAASRLLQLRLYGTEQVRALCGDGREGVAEEYALKAGCADTAAPRPEGELRRSLVFCDDSLRADAEELARLLRHMRYPTSAVGYFVWTPCCRDLPAEGARGSVPRPAL